MASGDDRLEAEAGPSEPRGRALTLRMLADRLDLSTATISLALRNSPMVAEATRTRVQALADELGYIVNRSAASLRTARSNMVGVVVHDVTNPYFAEIFRAVETALNAQNLAILVANHADDPVRQRNFLQTLMQHRADGLILCPAAGTTREEVDRIARTGLPTVLICRDVDGAAVPAVRGDDFAGGRAIGRHLVAQGHRRIAFVGGRRLTSAGRDRHAGFCAALVEAGIDPAGMFDLPGPMTTSDGREAAAAILAASPRPTAIFGFNDMVAYGLMSGLMRAGVEPGRDVAVSGYDDTDSAAWARPSLTSVHNFPDRIGEVAAQMLRARLDGKPVSTERILVEPSLHVRETTDFRLA